MLSWSEQLTNEQIEELVVERQLREQDAMVLVETVRTKKPYLWRVALLRGSVNDRSIHWVVPEVLLRAKEGLIDIRTLEIWENDLTIADPFVSALDMNTGLVELLLDGNSLGDAGAELLGKSLRYNGTLKKLSLVRNGITSCGANALALALKFNGQLRTLNLSANRISNHGATGLAVALTINRTLTALNLYMNPITEIGVLPLVDALKNNSALTFLALNVYSEAASKSLTRNELLVDVARSAALYLIAVRNRANASGMGDLQLLPKDVVKMIAKKVWETRGQQEWLSNHVH